MKHKIIFLFTLLTVTITSYADDFGSYQYVDLGLPSGIKWATCNIGAASMTDAGSMFAWGEIEAKDISLCKWTSYKHCNGTSNTINKYCPHYSSYSVIVPDGLDVLLLEDDAAHILWGDKWRMPTNREYTELESYCSWTKATYEGVDGFIVKSTVAGYTDKFIFLPKTNEITGEYWTSSARNVGSSEENMYATTYRFGFAYGWHNLSYSERCSGKYIRPVYDPNIVPDENPDNPIDQDVKKITFDFTNPISMDIDKPTVYQGTVLEDWSYTMKDATVAVDDAAENGDYGFYLELGKGCSLTISVPEDDMAIEKIVFDGDGLDNFTAIDGLDNNTWIGNTSSVQFTVKTGRGANSVYINTITVTYKSSATTLSDGEDYMNNEERDIHKLKYTRNFTNTNWNALYVPFAMSYNDWAEIFEVARLNDVHQFDDDEDGEIDRTVLELIKLKDGSSIEPNTPYLIKAKEIGEKTITLTDATLYAAEENSFDVTSWFTKFTFTGTYSTVTDMATKGHYAMADGGLKQATTDAATLGAFRWYLDVTDRNGNPTPLAGKKVLLSFDDGETTEVANVSANSCSKVSEVHTVSGMKIAKDKALQKKGVYIIDGNKILVR